MDDRLILHTVHTDDGATELYFGRAADDFPAGWSGSILFHSDGSFTYKMFRDDEEPFVLSVNGNRIVVANGEDQDAQAAMLQSPIAFDSDTFDPSEPGAPGNDDARYQED